jgi:ribosomal-protein-alanine N-acetyltransferase
MREVKAAGFNMTTYVSPLDPGDLSQVVQIERQAFPTLWPPTSFKRGLRSDRYSYLVAWVPRDQVFPQTENAKRYAVSDEQGEGTFLSSLVRGVKRLVSPEPVEDNGRFSLGFVGLWFSVEEAHITSIAVREDWRGVGLGELLMIGALKLAHIKGCRFLSLEVRVSNESAQALYGKYGFKKVGRRKRYYSDDNEDAFIMSTGPIGDPAYRKTEDAMIEAYRRKRGDFHLTFA